MTTGSTHNFQVVRFLGAGGYGEVYLCKWHACDVAVKSLSPALLMEDGLGGGNASEEVRSNAENKSYKIQKLTVI